MTENQRGALYMMFAMFAFQVNDALVKSMAGELPVAQILVLRSLMAGALILPLIWRNRLPLTGFSRRDSWLIILRSLAETFSSLLYVTALFVIPLADAASILQVVPLTVTLAGAFFLGEAVGWRRLTAILVGFCGALLILRPGASGFHSGALLALAAMLMVTAREVMTRAMSARVPSLTITFYSVVFAVVICSFSPLFVDWHMPDRGLVLRLVMTAVMVTCGYYFAVIAVRTGELAVVNPFRYSGLIFAVLFGIVAFGELPEPMTLLGGAIVCATGIFTLWREAQLRRSQQARAGQG